MSVGEICRPVHIGVPDVLTGTNPTHEFAVLIEQRSEGHRSLLANHRYAAFSLGLGLRFRFTLGHAHLTISFSLPE